jgi:hypothetical protein
MRCEYSCSQCIYGTCNWRMKTCDCQSGYTGIFCNQTTMIERIDEMHRCQLCHKGNTASCHMEVGRLFVLFKRKTELDYISNRKTIFDFVLFMHKEILFFTSSFRLASVNVCPVIVEFVVKKVSSSRKAFI